MQTSVRPDALLSASPLPAEHGAKEKLASGLQSSQSEANIWETQTLTPQMRWGNDDMHARYYNPNLGRFLSVDPVGGEVGSSQSWNRYAYVRNNPIGFTDPDGTTISLATGSKDASRLRSMLIRAITRPTERARLKAIAQDPSFNLHYQPGSLNTAAAIWNVRRGIDQKLRFGQTIRKFDNNKDRNIVGADVTVDVTAVEAGHPIDRSGVLTISHEEYHAADFRAGKSNKEVRSGDEPTAATGPAAQHGSAAYGEEPDISEEQAEAILEAWIREAEQAQSEQK